MGGPWCLSVFGFRLSGLEMVNGWFFSGEVVEHGCRVERLEDDIQERSHLYEQI
jgi:hypothetical protein